MYGVWGMHRTNIYLEERQLRALRAIAESRGESVAALIRGVVDQWLDKQGVEVLDQDEWERRFGDLLTRGRLRSRGRELTEADVEDEVALAVQEARAARRS